MYIYVYKGMYYCAHMRSCSRPLRIALITVIQIGNRKPWMHEELIMGLLALSTMA